MICPMMSRMIADKMTGDEPSVCISKLELIDCQKENCALWVVIKEPIYSSTYNQNGDIERGVINEYTDKSHCGLIQVKP